MTEDQNAHLREHIEKLADNGVIEYTTNPRTYSEGPARKAVCTISMLHGALRSEAQCPRCDYRAPIGGPELVAAAIDRLTHAIQQLAQDHRERVR